MKYIVRLLTPHSYVSATATDMDTSSTEITEVRRRRSLLYRLDLHYHCDHPSCSDRHESEE